MKQRYKQNKRKLSFCIQITLKVFHLSWENPSLLSTIEKYLEVFFSFIVGGSNVKKNLGVIVIKYVGAKIYYY